ncbi:hypothetical protein, partial [Paraclostridium sordellii]|uniref:hypothetical protein n=1 Tax=Paraclostridium sordellii TaxID=1505 RepID=UPI001AEC2B06
TWLIGQRCKCSNVCSLLILIDRGLDQDCLSNGINMNVYEYLDVGEMIIGFLILQMLYSF